MEYGAKIHWEDGSTTTQYFQTSYLRNEYLNDHEESMKYCVLANEEAEEYGVTIYWSDFSETQQYFETSYERLEYLNDHEESIDCYLCFGRGEENIIMRGLRTLDTNMSDLEMDILL